jgi:hypothetical protein
VASIAEQLGLAASGVLQACVPQQRGHRPGERISGAPLGTEEPAHARIPQACPERGRSGG